MSIILNGGENPSSVIFNGFGFGDTVVSEVVFNGVTVWERTPPDPPGLGTVFIGRGNFKIYLNDLKCTKKAGFTTSSKGTLYGIYEYSATVTAVVSVEKGEQVGVTNYDSFWQLHYWQFDQSDVSGRRGGLLNGVWLTDEATVGLGCYEYRLVNGAIAIGNRAKTGEFKLAGDHAIILNGLEAVLRVSPEFDGSYVVINDLMDEWTYEGPASKVELWFPITA